MQYDSVAYSFILPIFIAGYCRDKEMLRKVVKIIKELKQKNPNLLYGKLILIFGIFFT